MGKIVYSIQFPTLKAWPRHLIGTLSFQHSVTFTAAHGRMVVENCPTECKIAKTLIAGNRYSFRVLLFGLIQFASLLKVSNNYFSPKLKNQPGVSQKKNPHHQRFIQQFLYGFFRHFFGDSSKNFTRVSSRNYTRNLFRNACEVFCSIMNVRFLHETYKDFFMQLLRSSSKGFFKNPSRNFARVFSRELLMDFSREFPISKFFNPSSPSHVILQ